jgi:indolepyruvate ferredoxin oxidoreductase
MRAIELNALQVDFNKQAFAWGRVAAHDVDVVLAAAGRNGMTAQVIEFKRTPTLEELVERRVAFLTDYQNAAYARSYRDAVEEVRARESALGEAGRGLKLSRAVAAGLFKLMAYKDEYEVARLYAEPAFRAKIEGMFEGDYKLRFHLAPPLLAKRDDQGHLRKQAFGSWMMPAFGVLAKLRFLRGTAFDPFGYTEERKQERALITAYRATLSRLLAQLTPDNLEQVVAVARIPEEIRGYGHVKERHLKAAMQKQAGLLAQLEPAASSGQPHSPQGGGKRAA